MDEESLFEAASRLATETERRDFLDRACAGDDASRRRVERLLEAHFRTLDLLDRESGPAIWTELAEEFAPGLGAAADRAGTLIGGRYELRREIGRGGMGTVWLAEQVEPVRREVAVKLVRPGMDSRPVLARFEAERQALALMEHPNIARVLDGGTAGDGRPFFVMEYVPGVPITEYCDDARLDVDERLELFEAVCQAVRHAHARGIIHRDLKPGNILVDPRDGRAVPKVIDFGVAKAIQRPLVEQAVLTVVGSPLGTPLYMSPEQAGARPADVDTRADIYALGVLLYELLTGTTPLDRRRLHEAGWHEMLRLIREEEPPRPSDRLLLGGDSLPGLADRRRLEPSRLVRRLRGELDWIVMKCLEKDRSRRYETASALARDVRRHLDDEPVEACPPSPGYRLGKFLRRHRGPAIAASLIVLILAGGVVGTTWGLIRANRARQAEARLARGEREAKEQATRRLGQVEALAGSLASVFADLDPRSVEREGRPLGAILGDRLARVADQLEDESSGEPLLVADLQDRLGLALSHLGLDSKAAPLFERSRSARARLLGEEDAATLRTAEHLAVALGTSDRARSRSLLEETYGRMEAVLGPDHASTLDGLNDLAEAYKDDGDHDRAVPLFERALGRLRAKYGSDDPRTLTGLTNLAGAYRAAGQRGRAIPLFEEALPLLKAKLGPSHLDTLAVMNDLAGAYRADDRPDRAIPLYEEVVRRMKARPGPDHPDTIKCINNLAVAYRAAETPRLALPLLEEAYERIKANPDVDRMSTLAIANNLAGAYQATGQRDRALPLFEESLRLLKAEFGPDHPNTLAGMNNLASSYRLAGQHERSLALFREAAEGLERRKFQADAAGSVVHNLIGTLQQLRRLDEAEAWCRKWLAAVEGRPEAGQLALAGAQEALGATFLLRERWDDAEGWLRRSLELREAKAPDSWETLVNRSRLGEALLGKGDHARAEPLLVPSYEALKARESRMPPVQRVRVEEARERVAKLREASGKTGEAAKGKQPSPPRPPGAAGLDGGA